MTKCYISCRKSLFATYVGLVFGGYNLTDIEKVNYIYQLISQAECNEDTKAYFSMSSTTSCEVNPFWPRAFLLSLASFYISEDLTSYQDFHGFINHIESLDNINPTEKNVELYEWLRELPYYLSQITMASSFNELWGKYRDYELKQTAWINNEVEGIVDKIRNLLGDIEIDLPEIVYVPNCLQAPQATDYVRKDNKVYIIKSIPNIESFVHEYLHEIFNPYLKDNSRLITEYSFLLEPIYEEMLKYQYAWNKGSESWRRVFEENFMRAASTWVTYQSDFEKGAKICQSYSEQGFIYAPVIYDSLVSEWTDIESISMFISKCLNKCKIS